MLTRKTILSMTVAAGVAAAPMLAFGQANTGGSSMQSQTTQTSPREGAVSGTPAARDSGPGGASGTTTSQGTTVPGPTTAQSGTASPTPGTSSGTAATGTTEGTMAVDSMRLRDGRRASKVIGSTVYGGDGSDSIGSIDDLIVPREGGNPIAILSVGGFLGIGAKLVAVPYERLQHNADRDRWTLPGATKESLTALPSFAYNAERSSGSATGADRPARGGTGGGSAPTTPRQ